MAHAIGVVKSFVNGTFYVKDSKGEVHQLKVGEMINEGDHVYGAANNAANANIVIDVLLAGAGDLVLAGDGALQFDSSLLNGIFSHHDAVVYLNSVKDALAVAAAGTETKGAEQQPSDGTEAGDKTAAGDETAAGNVVTDTERLADTFAARDGAITDVTTDLRVTAPAAAETTVNLTETILIETPVTDIITLSDAIGIEGEKILEGGYAVIEAAVNTPVSNSPLIITLDNGATITILVGETTGVSTPFAVPNGEDVYIDPSSYTVGISSTSGGGYDQLDTSDTAKIIVSDTINPVMVSLSAEPTESEGANSILYTATLTGGVANNDIKVSLANGEEITIAAGTNIGTTTTATQADDVIVDGETVTNHIVSAVEVDSTSTPIADGTPGSLEDLQYNSSVVSTVVSDTINPVTATLGATSLEGVSEEGGDIIYTITLSGPAGMDIAPKTDLTFNLENGEQVTILAGTLSGSYTHSYTDGDIIDQPNITNSIDGIASGGGEYEKLITAGTTNVDIDYFPSILQASAEQSDALLDTQAIDTGSLYINYGIDGKGTININYDGGLGAATSTSVGGITTLTADTWTLTINETNGDYAFQQTDAYKHSPTEQTDSGIVTVTITDTDGDIRDTTLTLTIIDDVPSVTVNDMSVYRTADTTTEDYTFDVGGDALVYPEFMTSLTWNNMNNYEGYSFGLKAGSDTTYQATYVEEGITKTFFEINMNNNSTYDFTLVNPLPSSTVVTPNLFSNIEVVDTDLDGKTETGIIPDSNFSGAFELILTGSSNDGTTYGDTILKKSAVDIGIDGNSIQENQDERLKIEVARNAGYDNANLTSLVILLSSTGSISTGEIVDLKVTYTDTSSSTVSVPYDSTTQQLSFDIDQTKIVDYVELIPVTSNITLKVTGVEVGYTTSIDPADNTLDFTLNGVDSDGDLTSANFSVDLLAGTSGSDIIHAGDTNDTVSGGTGDDMIYGSQGNDTLIGGEGNDVLVSDIATVGGVLIGDTHVDALDGGVGTDTLVLISSSNIDFGILNSANNPITNVEIIDLSQNGDHQLLNITIQDVLDITGGSNTLTILGDSASDVVNLSNADGTWLKGAATVQESIGGTLHTFEVYTADGLNPDDPTVTLKVEVAITDTIG